MSTDPLLSTETYLVLLHANNLEVRCAALSKQLAQAQEECEAAWWKFLRLRDPSLPFDRHQGAFPWGRCFEERERFLEELRTQPLPPTTEQRLMTQVKRACEMCRIDLRVRKNVPHEIAQDLRLLDGPAALHRMSDAEMYHEALNAIARRTDINRTWLVQDEDPS